MATRAYSIKAQGPHGPYTQMDYLNVTVDSPRGPNGDLILKPNPHTLKRATSLAFRSSPSINGSVVYVPQGASINDNDFPAPVELLDWSKIDTVARAKFDGKVRKGRAGLGVQVIKYAQTRDMILGKYRQFKTVLTSANRRISQDKTLRDHLITLDRAGKLTANEVLQLQFGWKNLFSNLHAGLYTVMQDAVIANQWFTARHRIFQERRVAHKWSYNSINTHWLGTAGTSVSGQFVIDNPNYYLLDRSGILSVPAIAWDLVPWSWVVNMFANTNQIVNSLTDEIGIRWVDVSYTNSARFYRVTEQARYGMNNTSVDGAKSYARDRFDYRRRTVGHRPPIALMFRLPELDYNLATVAGAIILQKMRLISWAVKPARTPRPMNWREVFPPGYYHL